MLILLDAAVMQSHAVIFYDEKLYSQVRNIKPGWQRKLQKIDMIEPFYLFTTFYAPCFLHLIKSHPFPLALLNLRFSVDGNLVASASDDSLVFVWKPMDGTMVACHEHPMAVAWIEIDCCSSTWFRKSVQ